MTREGLIEAAADELNVTSVGQALAQEDHDKIDGRIDGLLANLATRGIVSIQDADSIPDSVSEQLGQLLAESCSKSFGKPRDPAMRERIEEEIRVIARRGPAPNKYLATDDAMRAGDVFTYSRWLYDR